jgi:ABC-type sugar transport system ATPase subunit
VRAGVLGASGHLLDPRRLAERAAARCRALAVRCDSVEQPVGALSGGNQQKVVLGKWLEVDPRVVLLDDPTRGVDVGAKAEIYEIVRGLAAQGRTVLFTSSELREFVLLCERVVVFFEGRVCGELAGPALSEHSLLEAINTGVVGEPADSRRP